MFTTTLARGLGTSARPSDPNETRQRRTKTAPSSLFTRLRLFSARTVVGTLLVGMLAVFMLGAAPLSAQADTSLASCPTMRTGSAGGCVRNLQAALVDRGYIISVDGQYGPQTAGAVMALQRNAPGLVVDGVAGPRTLGYLMQAPPTSTPAATVAAPAPAAPAAGAPKVLLVHDCGIVTCSYYLSRSTTAIFAGWADRNAWVQDSTNTGICVVVTAAVSSGATPIAGFVSGASCWVVETMINKFMNEAKNAAAGHGCLRIRVDRIGRPLMAYNDGGKRCRD